MLLVTFRTERKAAWQAGVQIRGSVVAAEAAARAAGLDDERVMAFRSVRSILRLTPDQRGALLTFADQQDGIAVAEVELGPPVPDPEKIICLGLNYSDHAAEAGLPPPSAPMFFAKYANSLIGPDSEIVPPSTTEKVDYEAELAVVVGTPGRNIAVPDALGHVAGVMALNDVSARDLQLANNLWTGGKAIDTFAPCGPALVTLDELDDIQDLRLRTRVNGALMQDGNTKSMIFSVAEVIAFLSTIMTLEAGDIIATGTPAGVGQSRNPPLYLKPGDVVETELEKVGTLRNTVAAPRAR